MGPLWFFWRGGSFQFLSNEEPWNVRRWRHDRYGQPLHGRPLPAVEELRAKRELCVRLARSEQPPRRNPCGHPAGEIETTGRLESASTSDRSGLSEGVRRTP